MQAGLGNATKEEIHLYKEERFKANKWVKGGVVKNITQKDVWWEKKEEDEHSEDNIESNNRRTSLITK